jgi:hypothetical protein
MRDAAGRLLGEDARGAFVQPTSGQWAELARLPPPSHGGIRELRVFLALPQQSACGEERPLVKLLQQGVEDVPRYRLLALRQPAERIQSVE